MIKLMELVTINNYFFVNKIMRNIYYFIFINLIITRRKKNPRKTIKYS